MDETMGNVKKLLETGWGVFRGYLKGAKGVLVVSNCA